MADLLRDPARSGLFRKVAGEEHLVLMRIVADDTYGRAAKRNGAYETDRVFATGLSDAAQPWTRLAFDSAINALPEGFYHRDAGLTDINLGLEIEAPQWRVLLFRRRGNDVPLLVASREGTGRASVDIPVEIAARPARLYFEVHHTGNLDLGWAGWTVSKPAALPKMGISITTYNKQDYLLPNIATIRESAAFTAGLIELLVVNNGNAITGLPDDVQLQTLDNVGGAGGFKAGYEWFARKGFAKFVVMDDDIALSQDFVDRMYALSCLVGACHIGSIAEILNTAPRIVKEQGANVLPRDTFGLGLHNGHLDLQGIDRHRLYEYHPQDFSGWWSLLVHIDAASPAIPSELFIKRDDIMFGYESRRRGIETVVFPNLHVAHSEEGAPAYYYYDIRNDLILRARNNDRLGLSVVQMMRIATSQLLALRHEEQKLFNMALADFLRGPGALERVGVVEKLKQVRAKAAKVVPVPEDAEPRHLPERPGQEQSFLSFLRPSAYRLPERPPVIEKAPDANACGIGAYFDPIPFTEKGHLRIRRFGALFTYGYALVLIALVYLMRGRMRRSYQSGSYQSGSYQGGGSL